MGITTHTGATVECDVCEKKRHFTTYLQTNHAAVEEAARDWFELAGWTFDDDVRCGECS